MIRIRKAVDADRKQIAYCIAEAYEKDFSGICGDRQIVADAIQSGIAIERYYVAVEDEETVVGAIAVADCNGRGHLLKPKEYIKHFGLIKGLIAHLAFSAEFGKKLDYPETVGYFEFACVLKRCRRQGIMTRLLEYAIADGNYAVYELDVTNVNEPAIHCYQKLGFSEYKREAVKYARQKGFSEKIYMRYQGRVK